MITKKSGKREIRDLQRLLIATGYLTLAKHSDRGWWSSETQEAVLAVYRRLGWEHPPKGKWITSAALAALASAEHHHHIGGPGSGETRTSGGEAHAGGTGSHAGGTGSHAGGTGSHAGGTGSHDGWDGFACRWDGFARRCGEFADLTRPAVPIELPSMLPTGNLVV